jgi:DNA-binding transcriptional regulator YdaS (Cro superfamily)
MNMDRAARRALARAIKAAGGQAALAAAIGVRQSHVSYWLHKSETGVPAERVVDIERATGVKRHELRPDLFAPPVPAPGHGFADDGAQFDDDSRSHPADRRDNFSRFKHLRRGHFVSREEIDGHILALREEWDRR